VGLILSIGHFGPFTWALSCLFLNPFHPNDKAPPSKTSPYDPAAFSCEGQDYGYYADVASGCEIFHICLPIQDNDGLVTSTAKYSFFCGNGTVFDQQALVCNHADDAFPCEESPSLFNSVPFGEVLDEDY